MTVVALLGAALLIVVLAARVRALSISERNARVTVTQLERELEDQVDAFGLHNPIYPRRREVVTFACELRGLPVFAATSSPMAVHRVLDEYFEVLGGSMARHGATVSGLSGDRLVGFFNDEGPFDDPVLRALTMATEIQQSTDALLERWPIGYDLGLGIGIALGGADIGAVAIDGRRDCIAVGPAVNLVQSLCDEARSGEILIDERAHAAVQGLVRVQDSAVISVPGVQLPALAIAARLLAAADDVIAS
jgi:adenylate cyclase